MYDLVSGKQLLRRSYYLKKTKALELFPMLKRDQLKGALVYYDGEFWKLKIFYCTRYKVHQSYVIKSDVGIMLGSWLQLLCDCACLRLFIDIFNPPQSAMSKGFLFKTLNFV